MESKSAHRRAQHALGRRRAVEAGWAAHKGHGGVPWAAVASQWAQDSCGQHRLPSPHLQARLDRQLHSTYRPGAESGKCHLGDALGIDVAVAMYLAVLVSSSLQHATAQKRRRTCQPCGLLFLKLAYQLRDAAGEGGP